MKPLFALTPVAISALGWTLIHFFWQGSLVALGLWAGLQMLKCGTARHRYWAACGALGLMGLLAGATFGLEWNGQSRIERGQRLSPAPSEESPARQGLPERDSVTPRTQTTLSPNADALAGARHTWESRVFPWLAAFWGAGVLLLSLRLGIGSLRLIRMKQCGIREMDAEWQKRLSVCRARLGMRRQVRLLQSTLARVPVVIGWIAPVILIPVSACAGLDPSQVEMILVHELAHLRRWDDWVNLVQIILETTLFYHPAVWWVSNQIRIEREYCCDDLAVAYAGDATGYARALTTLEELRASEAPWALAADGSPLGQRVRRLVGMPTQVSWQTSSVLLAVFAAFLISGVGAGAWALSSSAKSSLVPTAAGPSSQKSGRRHQKNSSQDRGGLALRHVSDKYREANPGDTAPRRKTFVLTTRFVEETGLPGATKGLKELIQEARQDQGAKAPGPDKLPSFSPVDGKALLVTDPARDHETGRSLASTNSHPMFAVLSAKTSGAVLENLRRKAGVDLLSAPRVTVSDGHRAQLQDVTIKTIVTGPKPATESAALGPTVDLLPQWDSTKKVVRLSASATVLEFLGYQGGAVSTATAKGEGKQPPHPRFRLRKYEDVVGMVPLGCTLALDGLVVTNSIRWLDKVPVLGDIPFLRRWFRKQGHQMQERRLMVFITVDRPHQQSKSTPSHAG